MDNPWVSALACDFLWAVEVVQLGLVGNQGDQQGDQRFWHELVCCDML